MRLYRFISQHKWQLLSLSALIIFREKVIEWIIEYICPITSYVKNDSWLVLVTFLLTIGILYTISYRQIKIERERIVSRYWTILWILIVYMIFRIDTPFFYYGIGDIPLCYIDYAWILVLILEFILFIRRNKRNDIAVDSKIKAYPFIMDTPAVKDEMGRGRYAEQLIDKIIAANKKQRVIENEKVEGAFIILLNEHYGVGKTSFLLQLQNIAEKKGLDVCWFKPWLYDENSSLIINLVHVLQEKLGDGDRPLAKMLDRYARVLSSVEKYEWVSILQHDTASIETRFKEIKEKLHELKLPIVVLIDDVDRLQSEEMMRMLQMVRNMADFPNVYYIIAGDKAAIMSRLSEAQIAEPYEYIKKFFNLEICFPGVDGQIEQEIETYIKEIQKRYEIEGNEIIDFIRNLSYKNELFANIRDVKRYVNLLDFDIANIYRKGLLGEVCLRDVAGLCIIQSLDSEFYQLLRDHNNYVLQYQTEVDKFYVKRGFEKALSYGKNIREAASLYGTADALVAETGTLSSEAKILSIGEVIERSQINTIEIICDILYRLFPDSSGFHSRIGICYPTEYFKYFSASYKKNEMTNAEIIGIMEASDEEYAAKIQKIINDSRILAYIHKLEWYITSHDYKRLPVLEKVLMAFAKHFKSEARQGTSADVFFDKYYNSAIIYIFKNRDSETNDQRREEWGIIYRWLTSSTDYTNRIRILQTILNIEKDAHMYIFDNIDVIRDCIHASAYQYISGPWSKYKYTPAIYARLDTYRQLCKRVLPNDYVSDAIIDLLTRNKSTKYFLYHLVEPYNEGLKWNKKFIECVTGDSHVFLLKKTKWFALVPIAWKTEIMNLSKKDEIKQEDIENSNYLKAALRYLNSKMKKDSSNEN